MTSTKKIALLLGLALFIITFSTFRPALLHDFVWDDSLAIVANTNIRGFTAENLLWAATTRFAGHYQPLSWLTLMMDYEIWGMQAYGFHLSNIIIHALNAVLLFMLVIISISVYNQRFPLSEDVSSHHDTRGRVILLWSFLAVLFYALHPLRVESVVWATERRDVLSIFFILGSLIFYFRHLQRQSPGTFSIHYFLCLLAFFLSLLCKAWAITYPVVLILTDLVLANKGPVIRQALTSARTKLPFFLLSLIFAFLAYTAQSGAGAVISWEKMGLVERLLQSAHGFNMYLVKTVYPFNLSPLYSLAQTNFFQPYFYCHFVIALILLSTCILSWKKTRLPLLLFTLYLVILSPVIGITQSGPQYMADRYSYFALILFSLTIAISASRLLHREVNNSVRVPRTVYVTLSLGAIIVVALSLRTSDQIKIWKNEETLWTHAIDVDPGNFQALINRAETRARNGLCASAIEDYSAALSMVPANSYALNGRAHCLLVVGNNRAALDDLNRAISIYPMYVNAWFNRAVVLNNLGDTEAAILNFTRVLSLIVGYDEGNSYARNTNYYLGVIYLAKQDTDNAIKYLSRTISIDRMHGAALYHRALAYEISQNTRAARSDLSLALSFLEKNSDLAKKSRTRLEQIESDL